MVNTIKFSQMTAGGDLAPGEMTPGLLNVMGTNINVLFNNPWTFLAPGSTAQRPAPGILTDYLLRFNTDTQEYEYYNAITMDWITLVSSGGSGTINPGVTNDLVYYPGDGQTLSPITAAANSVLITSNSSVPSLSTTLPSGLIIPGVTINASSTASLASGQVAATPVNPTDIANKAYVDAVAPPGVSSITGTAFQVIASASTGDVTLSLPQSIDTTSSPTFAALTLTAPLTGANGGTGVANTGSTFTMAGNVSFVGAYTFAGTLTGNTAVTFPTSGTLATTSQIPSVTPAAFTTTNDANVTATLTGTPATSLLQAVSLTLGWTGDLAISRGGTGVGSVTTIPAATSWAGWDANKNLAANNTISALTSTVSSGSSIILTVASTQIQNVTGSTAQTVQMPVVSTLPETGTSFILLNNSSATMTIVSSGSNIIGAIAAGNSATVTCVLLTGTTAASWFMFVPGFTPSAFTAANDTNVTATLTGFPTVALLEPMTFTLGWTGQLGLTRGGTNASLTTSNGGIVYSNASSLAILSGTSTANQLLVSGASTTPQWTTSTYPLTNAVNTLLYASSANVMAALATANSSVLITSTGGVPSLSTTLPSGISASGMVLTSPKIITSALDTNGNTLFTVTPVASAVNYLTFVNAATAGNPVLGASGSDSNVQLQLIGKGTSGVIEQGATNGAGTSAGYKGEIIQGQVLGSAAVSLTTTTAKDVTNISLTAGNWIITGNAVIQSSIAAQQGIVWVSATSATLPDVSLRNQIAATFTVLGLETFTLIVRPTSTTTYYLSAYCAFASGTSTACGSITALRI
jgi:hypothetical protein